MTDRELLELAANAATIALHRWNEGDEVYSSGPGFILPNNAIWNPLTDDGDALRLAVKLRIGLAHDDQYLGGPVIQSIEALGPRRADWSRHCEMACLNCKGEDRMAATRRAIVLVAAEIGKAMS